MIGILNVAASMPAHTTDDAQTLTRCARTTRPDPLDPEYQMPIGVHRCGAPIARVSEQYWLAPRLVKCIQAGHGPLERSLIGTSKNWYREHINVREHCSQHRIWQAGRASRSDCRGTDGLGHGAGSPYTRSRSTPRQMSKRTASRDSRSKPCCLVWRAPLAGHRAQSSDKLGRRRRESEARIPPLPNREPP